MKIIRLIILIISLALVGGHTSLHAYETHTGTYTFNQLLYNGVGIWIDDGSTPEQTDKSYPFRTHPWLTLMAIKLFQDTYQIQLTPEIRRMIIYGSIEEDFDVEGTSVEHVYSNLLMSDVATWVQGDKQKTLNINRCENHFMNFAYDSEGLTETFFGIERSVKRKSAAAWAINNDTYNTANWPNAIARVKAGYYDLTGWRYLGHVLHLLEDMASPAHVRDDAHIFNNDNTEDHMGELSIRDHFDLMNRIKTDPLAVMAVARQSTIEKTAWQYFAGLSDYTQRNFYSDSTMFTAIEIDDSHEVPDVKITAKDDEEYYYSTDDEGHLHRVAYKGFWYTAYYKAIKNPLLSHDPNAEETARVACTIDDKVAEDTFSLAGRKAIEYSAGLIKLFYDATRTPQVSTPQVSAGVTQTVGLKLDGTVVAAGNNAYDLENVSKWTSTIQLSAGFEHTVGLKSDGTVVAVGSNSYGECNVTDWVGIIQVSAGVSYTVGLKSDGTVVAVGSNSYGQCNVSSWTGIIQISAGYNHTVGLKSDGTVVAVGQNEYNGTVTGACDVSGWTGIRQVSAGEWHTVGLKSDGTVVTTGNNSWPQCNVNDWKGIIQVSAEKACTTAGLKSDGTVVATGWNNYGECNVSEWKDITQVSASPYVTVGLKSDGTVVAVGYSIWGAENVSGWNLKTTSP